jgi:hypothetical protein
MLAEPAPRVVGSGAASAVAEPESPSGHLEPER